MDNVGYSGKFHPHQLFSLGVVHHRGYPPLRARQGGQSGPLAAVDCPTGQGPSRQEETAAEVRDDWVRRDVITALELWIARISSLASPPSLQVPCPSLVSHPSGFCAGINHWSLHLGLLQNPKLWIQRKAFECQRSTHDLPATLQFITPSSPIPCPFSFYYCFPGDNIELCHWLSASRHLPWRRLSCELAGHCFQYPCLPDSPEPRQSREAATNILVSTQEECRGRREGVLSNGWKLQAGRLGLNVKTRLRTSEMRRLGFQAVFGLGTHHLFPFDHWWWQLHFITLSEDDLRQKGALSNHQML